MEAALRVLVVDDSEDDAALERRTLEKGGRAAAVFRVDEAAPMREALARDEFDVVLCDWTMPHFSAIAALRVLQSSGRRIPFVIVTGTARPETIVEAMRAGASDYVMKDDLERLVPAVERALREAREGAARRLAEDTLRAEQARFAALIERSVDGITLTDVDFRVLYASPGAKRILGLETNDPAGRSVVATVHPSDRDFVAKAGRWVREVPLRTATFESRLVRDDGGERWVETTLVNRIEDPDVRAVVANFRDITATRKANEALRESEQRFRRLWESGVVGLAVSDLEAEHIDANDALLDIVGYTRADLEEGKIPWRAITPPEHEGTQRLALEQLRRTGRASPWEKEYVRKDGTRIPVLVAIAKHDERRNVTIIVDISRQKHAEAEHAKVVTTLQAAEAQLRQAQKMEAIGRLAGGVAHDFNNMLSVILSFGEMALEDVGPDSALHGDMEEICKAARRAAALTKQLLVFSRKQVLDPTLVDLNRVLAGMRHMLAKVLGEDIELTTVLPASVGSVFIDASAIEQVIVNLALNARDAMPTGGQLTIETAAVVLDTEFARQHIGVAPGAHVMLAVSDTGHGMDAATLSRIFEPFFTTKPVGKGTGLGLSTVFGIVQQSDGTVWVYSEPGKGTTFKVYLPQRSGAPLAEAGAPAATSMHGTETILLVEDEEGVRAVATTVLRRAGYRVLVAANADEAIRHVEADGVIHLLLTDVVMPQISGPALAKRLTASRPDMKVVCMSGYTDDSVVRHGVLDATIAFVQKPFTPETLRRKIREVLDAPGPTTAARER